MHPTLPLPAATIIVPAHNAARYLPRCLASIREAMPEGTQLIVVDDASTDDTARIARNFTPEVISGVWHNPGPARNAGAAQARGNILIFLDADTVAAPDTITSLIAALADPTISAVFGSYDTNPAAPQTVSRFKNLMHHFVHQQNPGPATTFWTGCGAIRRQVFEGVGGLRPISLRCVEDIDFGMRLARAGHAIILRPDIQVKHLKRWTLANLIKTDVLGRAIPWTYMIANSGQSNATLNTCPKEKLALVLVLLYGPVIVAPAVADHLAPAAAGLGVLISMLFLWVKWPLLHFFFRQGGLFLALASVPLLIIYYLYSAAGFVAGSLLYLYDKTANKIAE